MTTPTVTRWKLVPASRTRVGMGKKNRRRNAKKTNASVIKAPAIVHRVDASLIPRDCWVAHESLISTPDINLVVDAILSRGVENKFLSSKENLSRYLRLFNEKGGIAAFLKAPLMEALLSPKNINQLVGYPGAIEPISLLMWVCQWKYLHIATVRGWPAEDELVDMVIQAGADVNYLQQNQTNALFHAVKYGSPRTVDLLLEAGINFRQVDNTGNTCLKDALEYPTPAIVGRLLDLLPATETIVANVRQDDKSYIAKTVTLTDHILQLFFEEVNPASSWTNLFQPPEADDVIETLILVRQKGARFSSQANWPLRMLGNVYRPDGDSSEQILRAPPDTLRKIAKYLIGSYIPETHRPDGLSEAAAETQLKLEEKGKNHDDNKQNDKEETCKICLGPFRKSVLLYCGHAFCRKCILEYAETSSSLDPPPSCPSCKRPLCSELLPLSSSLTLSPNHHKGVRDDIPVSNMGPHSLLDEQIFAEARHQGIDQSQEYATPEALRSKFVDDLADCKRVMVNTSSSESFAKDGSLFLTPTRGPVCVEILVEGIPMLAHVSNQSRLTVIAQPVVEMMRLRKIEKLQSNEFVSVVTGEEMGNDYTFTCLKPISIGVGEGINVTLCNAVEMSPDETSSERFGIELGQDFLSSGRWCPMDVEVGTVDGDRFARVDGYLSWLVDGPAPTLGETLRFYSHEGKMASIPLLHFSPCVSAHAVTLEYDVEFEQCSWCCLAFPEGMLLCAQCQDDRDTPVFYCSEECQRAAWKIHKRRCHKRFDSQDHGD